MSRKLPRYYSDFASVPDWNKIDWDAASRRVTKIQYRIFRAKRCQNTKRLHWLQRALVRSVSARLLAVRQVTTLNKGKRTALAPPSRENFPSGKFSSVPKGSTRQASLVASGPAAVRAAATGFDRRVADTPKSKLRLAQNLSLDGKSLPIRRVWLPKPGKTEKRPLGIPVITDRAKQMLAKLALEPEWEAVFEPNSYGFRAGRGCLDAIEAIFLNLRAGKPKFVFDADIAKCFDRIDHSALLRKIDTFPEMESQISAWLSCGVVEGFAKSRAKLKDSEITPTSSGTPQDGVISPLLANIALHGLENHLVNYVGRRPGPSGRSNRGFVAKSKALGFVRYADDFVIIHDNLEILNECIHETRVFLARMGLEISEEKSSIRNSRDGFLFLGFQCIMIRRKYGNWQYKIHIRPSNQSVRKLLDKVKVIIGRNKSASSYELIEKLRPLLLGWANYFRYCECSGVFGKLTHAVFLKLRAWVFRRSIRIGRRKTRLKYFPEGKYTFDGKVHRANWVLVGKKKEKDKVKTNFLPHLSWVSSRKHVKVKSNESPYNPDSVIYWSNRMAKYSPFPSSIRHLLKVQNSKCTLCGVKFTPLEVGDWEIDHIIPRDQGGSGSYSNLQLVHKSCHIKKTRSDLRSNRERKRKLRHSKMKPRVNDLM